MSTLGQRIGRYLDRLAVLHAFRRPPKPKGAAAVRSPSSSGAKTFESEVPPPPAAVVLNQLHAVLDALWEGSQRGLAPTDAVARVLPLVPRRGPSSIPGAGTGLFATSPASTSSEGKQQVPPGTLMALYPGTVYGSQDPVLLASVGNAYILRRGDGILVDGKTTGLSRWVAQGLGRRYQGTGARWPPCDMTWVEGPLLRNPLAVGQFVNCGDEATEAGRANVAYVDFELDLGRLPLHLHQYVPNVPYVAPVGYPKLAGPTYSVALGTARAIELKLAAAEEEAEALSALARASAPEEGTQVIMPMVGLVTTRVVHAEDELFSTYCIWE
ncbi:hypothetical protein BC828DRAFT_71765 [Blastocladiella britannica]|nr:hypothetical protein BC828DRAFT_71765 [Blastocladiella britannica]